MDHTNMCRTCLAPGQKTIPLSSLRKIGKVKIPIGELLFRCCSIEIKSDDDLPKNICKKCSTEIRRSYIFRQQCIESDNALKKKYPPAPAISPLKVKISYKDDSKCFDIVKKNTTFDKSVGEIDGKSAQEINKKRKSESCNVNVKKKCIDAKENLEPKIENTINKLLKNLEKEISSNIQIEDNSDDGDIIVVEEVVEECDLINVDDDDSNGNIYNSTNEMTKLEKISYDYGMKKCSFDCDAKIYSSMYETSTKNPELSTLLQNQNPNIQSYNQRICDKVKDDMNKENLDEGAINVDDIEAVVCDKCNEAFPSHSLLKIHWENKHKLKMVGKMNTNKKRNRQDSVFDSIAPLNRKYPYKCFECDANFASLSLLNRHSKTHKDSRPLECDICRMRFKFYSSYAAHYARHKEQKPGHLKTHEFECFDCGNIFSTKAALRRHIMREQGIRPHKCETCGKEFVEKSYLLYHIACEHSFKAGKGIM